MRRITAVIIAILALTQAACGGDETPSPYTRGAEPTNTAAPATKIPDLPPEDRRATEAAFRRDLGTTIATPPAPTPETRRMPLPRIEGGTVTVLGTDPPTLDPHQSGDTASASYVLEIFGGLMTLNPQVELEPDLAESWDLDETGTKYTFRLRENLRFHDGKTVTATDVAWSMNRSANPATEGVSPDVFLGDIEGARAVIDGEARTISGVNAIDDLTLRIDLEEPRSYFLSKMSYPVAFTLDRQNVEKGRGWTQEPNGTGPFRLAEYEPGVRVLLEKNPDYHLGPANIDRVEILLSGGEGLLMYENDEIHLGAVAIAVLDQIQDEASPLRRDLQRGPPEFNVYYTGMNTGMAPFDDPKVRLALNYAIDREQISEVLLEGALIPAKGILPPGFPGYNPEIIGYGFNPERARALLAESKYGADTSTWPPIILTMPGSFGSAMGPVEEAIMAMWSENLGLEVEILQTEWATYLDDLRDNRMQMFGSLGWVADYPDPENFLDVLFHSESSTNASKLDVPEIDRILEDARSERDEEKRFQMYRNAEELILEQAPWVLLWHSAGEHYLIKHYLRGYPLTPLVVPKWRYVYLTERR